MDTNKKKNSKENKKEDEKLIYVNIIHPDGLVDAMTLTESELKSKYGENIIINEDLSATITLDK